jgi:hypothetical protein
MFLSPIQRLLREWAALAAVFAMVLGPLALATSRSLSAQERISIAAGLAALPVCIAGDTVDGLASKTGGGSCDHCLPTQGGTVPELYPAAADALFACAARLFAERLVAFTAYHPLPPATGPPAL